MITKLLINLGLVLTPFFIMPGFDVRDIKLAVAANVALALSLSGLYQGIICKVNNKWFFVLLGYCLLSSMIAPDPEVKLLGIEVGNFWIWQPMYNYLVFGLMIIVVSSIQLFKEDINLIVGIMIWCGFLMACYMILQGFKIDQFFNCVGVDDISRMAGTIGNPTHAAPFVAMLVPLALYKRRYLFSAIMIAAVIKTTGQVAICAMIVGLITMVVLKYRYMMRLFVALAITAMLCFTVSCAANKVSPLMLRKSLIHDNLRFMAWSATIKDVNAQPFLGQDARYPLTGWGMGNFKYTFHFSHADCEPLKAFFQAHNEYLESLYNTGIIGFILLIVAILTFIRDKWRSQLGGLEISLLSGFICIAVAAGGTFIWQIGTTAFYTCMFVGLLNNEGVRNA